MPIPLSFELSHQKRVFSLFILYSRQISEQLPVHFGKFNSKVDLLWLRLLTDAFLWYLLKSSKNAGLFQIFQGSAALA